MRKTALAAIAAAIAVAAHAADPGFVDLFDGRTLNGWKPNGGSAEYRVKLFLSMAECPLANADQRLFVFFGHLASHPAQGADFWYNLPK